jgi:uncharacterized protein (TIGR00251 family)
MVKFSASGVEIDVRVIPRASKTRLAGERDGRLLVRLAAPPVDGAANSLLIEFLTQILGVPRRSVRLLAGARSREKRIAVDGMTVDEARVRLAPARSAR